MVWLEFCSRLGCEEFYWCIGLFWTWIHRSILDLCQNAFIFVILWNEIIYLWQYIYIYIYITSVAWNRFHLWIAEKGISLFLFSLLIFPCYLYILFLIFHYYVSLYLHLVCQLHLSMSIHFHQSIIKYFLLQFFIRIDPLIHEYTLSPFYDKIFFPLAFYKY